MTNADLVVTADPIYKEFLLVVAMTERGSDYINGNIGEPLEYRHDEWTIATGAQIAGLTINNG